jgi:hypothetical protein
VAVAATVAVVPERMNSAGTAETAVVVVVVVAGVLTPVTAATRAAVAGAAAGAVEAAAVVVTGATTSGVALPMVGQQGRPIATPPRPRMRGAKRSSRRSRPRETTSP